MRIAIDIHLNVSGSYFRLDTFKDENITIKENVKDFRDVKKVFTSMSRTFTVPASKNNNIVLKHFYRNDIVGVDTRALIDAKLTLNNVDYKFGNVSVEDVKFKDNEPYSYSLRFYGNLTELNKNIGDDELTDLDLSSHNIQSPDFFDEFQKSTLSASQDRDVVFPLLSRNRRFLSHSGDSAYSQTNDFTDAPNISYVNNTRIPGFYGVVDQDLVGALRTGAILDAIEAKYGLNFTGVFNDAGYIRDLRLLLLKRGGDGLDGNTMVSKNIVNFTPLTNFDDNANAFKTLANGFITETIYEYENIYTHRRGELDFQVSTTSSNFKVHIKRNGETIQTVEDTNAHTIRLDDYAYNNSVYTFEAEVLGIATINISATIHYKRQAKASIITIRSRAISGSISFTGSETDSYVISENLPQMKIIDFIGDLFKRFNVVATVDANLNVDTQHFDYYINQGRTIDISEYVDVSSHKIGRPNFHSGIRFTTEKVETVSEYGFQKVNGRKYGELKFDLDSGGSKLDGEMYKVDLKSKMIPVDNPIDVRYGSITNFQSMVLVDKKGEEIQLAPTFLYTKIMDFRYIAYDNGSTVDRVNSFLHIPSEVYYPNEDMDTVSLGEFVVGSYFAAEPSVILSPDLNFRDANLFNAFYSKTISVAFNESSRRAEYTAFLPMKVLHNLSTADKLIIANKIHLIESYTTNFLTGKTSLSLIQVDGAVSALFDSKAVVVGDSNSSSSSYMDASTGLATLIYTDNTTSQSVIGGASGVYRTSFNKTVSDNNIGTLSMIGDSRFTNHEIKTAIEQEVTVQFVGSTSDGAGGLDDAIGGDTSADLAARASNVPNNANYYLWHFGTNDSGANNLSATTSTLFPLMTQLLSYGGKVVYVRQIPRSDSNEQFCIDLDEAMISQFGSQFHAVIDARSTFNNLDDPFNTHYSDHVHLNSTGNALFGELLGQNLN